MWRDDRNAMCFRFAKRMIETDQDIGEQCIRSDESVDCQ